MDDLEKISVTFCDANGDNIFSARMECAPRIGEIISFAWNVFDGQQQEWNVDDWYHLRGLDGNEYIVTEVRHEFRQYRINSLPHILFVQLELKSNYKNEIAASNKVKRHV